MSDEPARPDEPRPGWPPAAVWLVLAGALLASWWIKARCLADGVWTGGEQWTAYCYTDVAALFVARGLDVGLVPYVDTPIEYPPLTGLQQWAAAVVADGDVRVFVGVVALLGAAAMAVVVATLAREGVSRARLLLLAASPTVVLLAFVNFDPVPVACAVAALALLRRGRDGWAGVLVGLGTAAKLYPAVVAVVAVWAAVREGRGRDAARHLAGAVAGAAVVTVPVLLAAPDALDELVALNRTRFADWDSLWFLVERLVGAPFSPAALNLAVAVLVLAGWAWLLARAGAVLPSGQGWRATLPLLVWFLLANKVYSPQFSLWLAPLLVWQVRDVRRVVAFLAADAAVVLVRFPFLGAQVGESSGPDYPWLAAAVVVRALVLVAVVADVLGPEAGDPPAVAAGRGGGPVSALDLDDLPPPASGPGGRAGPPSG